MHKIFALLGFFFSLPVRLAILLANTWSKLRSGQIPAYIRIDLGERVQERTTPPSFIWRKLAGGPEPQSLEDLRRTLLSIASDPRPKGLILRVDRTDLTLVRAQTLASLLTECRQASKKAKGRSAPLQIVCYLFQCNAPAYLVGAVADRLYLAPLTTWDLKGLYWSNRFLRRFLDSIGVEFDVVRAGRWKSATSPLTSEFMDALERSHMADVMDSYRQQIVEAIALGRQLPLDKVETALNKGPLLPQEARCMHLVDDVCSWAELPQRLAGELRNPPENVRPVEEVRGLLRRTYRRKFRKSIGLIEVKGMISFGSAGGPAVPGTAGRACNHADLLAAIQKAQDRHRQLAGVILFVDSPGGSALASHVVLDALHALASKLPLVVYMGGVAASGGYYLAMGGAHIIAQGATLTGSIGVFSAKPVISRLLQRLGILTAELAQSEHASLYSSNTRWSPAQRKVMQTQVEHIYAEFKRVVSEGRNMDACRVEELAEGKVWTGQQAVANRLVDETGTLAKAVQHIRDLAEVPLNLEMRILDLGARKKVTSLYSDLVPSTLVRWLKWTQVLSVDSQYESEDASEVWMLADELV